ncbi:RebB family R body protein [Polymorphum gilvum]|uniref:Uncharacterized protein n=1 Tax=Polymorphum gilvum (strain LMG 25793 / CGMCC 1.9160 / SL003B-26A1) TaxID=991905 RepID=F2J350_POLGS|nr:RebB family R body protein [Polymorphum gilvum]ADZ69857.1 hypothetical protein SL003B_1429 [Polymorphum gilvum SL003B-26A1]
MPKAAKPSAPPADLIAMLPDYSPALAMSAVYGAMAHSMAVLFENAVATQRQQTLLADLAVLEGIQQMNGLSPQSASAADKIRGSADLAAFETILSRFGRGR